MFMPTQFLGFILIGVGLLSLLFEKKKEEEITTNVVTLSLILLVLAGITARQENGSIVFIVFLVIEELMIATSLSYLAIKNKNWLCLVLFIVSCIALIVMGAMKPLSTKLNMDVTTTNWIEKAINIVAQGTLVAGAFLLTRNGFLRFKDEKKEDLN